jgi:hypothetical protein
MYAVYAVSILAANYIAGTHAMRVAHRTLSNPNRGLPDVLHAILPRVHIVAPDIAVTLALLISFPFVERSVVDRVLVCFLVRPIFVCATTLPSPIPAGAYFHTHDLMFSGHTILFLGAAATHTHILCALLLGIGGPLLLVAARQHYTIDVLVAAVVFISAPQIVQCAYCIFSQIIMVQ